MTRIWLDDETFSPEPITNGIHKYAEGAEVMIRALALDDGDVIVTDLTPGGDTWTLCGDDLVPTDHLYCLDITCALEDDQVEVFAHNSHFDRTVERHAGLQIPLHRWRDTMVQALSHSLPGSLGALCEVLKVDTDKAKDKAGKALIQLFCRPIPFRFRKREPLLESVAAYTAEKAAAEAAWSGRATRETHPAEWRQFLIYAGRDILAMRECHRRMPKWNYPDNAAELALWHLDQTINDRGVAIDLDLAEAAVAAVDAAQVDLRARTADITNGEVESATKRDAMLLHVLAEYGVDLPDLQMATLERRIADPDLPAGLRELLQIRLQASTTSTSKYRVLLRGTSSDSRLRGLLQFCGAARTGRWAGRLWQPQNLPRPVLKQADIDVGIDALKAGCAHLIYDNVMELTSSAIRGCIVAPAGKKLVVADLSNIEGRVLAWLAGETWKLKAFADFDTVLGQDDKYYTGPQFFNLCMQHAMPALQRDTKGEPIRKGHDLYKLSYGKSFGVAPEDVTKDQRQVGKVQELALGYEGGVGAFLTFAAAYGIDLEALAATARRAIPGNVWGQANIMFEWHRDKKKKDPAAAVGLSKDAWLVCESFKLGWRDAHPNIRQFWKDIDEAVRGAIGTPGQTFLCRMIKVRRDGNWLRIGLPSGRALCYPSPEIVDGKITYMGVNQYSRKWARLDTYGGKLAENITQAVARDVMAANMPHVEDAGYQIVLSVHDELLSDAPDEPTFNPEHLSSILAAVPKWAPGLPLAAAGFEGLRYRKE